MFLDKFFLSECCVSLCIFNVVFIVGVTNLGDMSSVTSFMALANHPLAKIIHKICLAPISNFHRGKSLPISTNELPIMRINFFKQ